MRLIDADELKPDYIVPSTSTGTVSTQYVSLFQILNAPTADVVEVKHGEWIFGFDEETGERDLKAWTCSLCGEKYPWQPNFCPHCGAKMDGKETEDG